MRHKSMLSIEIGRTLEPTFQIPYVLPCLGSQCHRIPRLRYQRQDRLGQHSYDLFTAYLVHESTIFGH